MIDLAFDREQRIPMVRYAMAFSGENLGQLNSAITAFIERMLRIYCAYQHPPPVLVRNLGDALVALQAEGANFRPIGQ